MYIYIIVAGGMRVYFDSAGTQFKGNPFSGGAKHTGVEKFGDFWEKSPFISETVRDRPTVAMER